MIKKPYMISIGLGLLGSAVFLFTSIAYAQITETFFGVRVDDVESVNMCDNGYLIKTSLGYEVVESMNIKDYVALFLKLKY